jgi:hypothetical protein
VSTYSPSRVAAAESDLHGGAHELKSRGVDVVARRAASDRPRLGLSIWCVAVNDKAQPRQWIHADRGCMRLNDTRLQGDREATEAEIARLSVCSTCG